VQHAGERAFDGTAHLSCHRVEVSRVFGVNRPWLRRIFRIRSDKLSDGASRHGRLHGRKHRQQMVHTRGSRGLDSCHSALHHRRWKLHIIARCTYGRPTLTDRNRYREQRSKVASKKRVKKGKRKPQRTSGVERHAKIVTPKAFRAKSQ
jgi:hypothetical protein